jgi:hypothetical protein
MYGNVRQMLITGPSLVDGAKRHSTSHGNSSKDDETLGDYDRPGAFGTRTATAVLALSSSGLSWWL